VQQIERSFPEYQNKYNKFLPLSTALPPSHLDLSSDERLVQNGIIKHLHKSILCYFNHMSFPARKLDRGFFISFSRPVVNLPLFVLLWVDCESVRTSSSMVANLDGDSNRGLVRDPDHGSKGFEG